MTSLTSRLAFCGAIVVASATGIAAHAQAPLCNAVLDARAFNIYDTKTASDFQNVTFDQMCKTQWTSISDYENSAKSLGSGGQYGTISGFLNMNGSDVSNTLKQAFDQLCTKKDQFLRDRLFSQSHTQIADSALSAWSTCVKSTSAGLYSSLLIPPDGKRFSIHVHFRGTGPDEKLTFKGYRKDAGYNCKYADNDITDFTPRDHGLTDTEFDLSCERTVPSHVQVSISTDKESIGLFDVPSEEFLQLNRVVNKLQDTNDRLNTTVTELSKQLATERGKKFEFVVRRNFIFSGTARVGCDEANGEALVAGSCIGALNNNGTVGSGTAGSGPFLFNQNQSDFGGSAPVPLHTVECRFNQSITALAVCMRVVAK